MNEEQSTMKNVVLFSCTEFEGEWILIVEAKVFIQRLSIISFDT